MFGSGFGGYPPQPPRPNSSAIAIESEMRVLEKIDATRLFINPTRGDHLDRKAS
jgi:hypothetical protein